MKIIKYLAVVILSIMTIGLSSCSKEFLERVPNSALSNSEALNSISKIEAATVGIMPFFAIAAYSGRNLTVIGDLVTDNLTTLQGNSGHLLDIENWNISSSLSEVTNIWIGSYQIVSTSAKVIQACDNMLSNTSLAKSDRQILYKCKATALTAKVYAEYIATQYFCLPYSTNASSTNGIILVTTPINPSNAVDASSTLSTATLEATYTHMHNQLKSAITLYDSAKTKTFITTSSAYFPSLCMAYTMQARLFLEQAKYPEAIEAVESALGSLPTGTKSELVSSPTVIYTQYQDISKPTTEDILTINFTTSDNLSANSINNMFGSYGAALAAPVKSLYKSSDIRRILYAGTNKDLKIYGQCGKYPNENNINNVPVLRVPELYLIKAEAYALTGDDLGAKTELLKCLGVRDTSIHGEMVKLDEKYFNKGQDILGVILEERRREFAGEGHRWFDLRRNRQALTHTLDDYRISFTNFPIYEFAFPIPESETNTGAWKNGLLKQNEAWTGTPGKSYKSVLTLPYNGASY